MSVIKKISIIFVLLFNFVYTQYSACINPQNKNGYCVPLQTCNFVLNIVRYQQQNYEAQVFLRQSQCGFDGYGYTLVCCPQQTTNLKPHQSQQSQLKNIETNQNLLPKECGVESEDRIFGGTVTKINEFPWFSLLKYSKPGSADPLFSCGGSLISDRYVVTAAHCVHTKIIQRIKLIAVRLGEWNLTSDPDCDDSFVNEEICAPPVIDLGIEEVIIHENYIPLSYHQNNDIALIRMSQKVTFSEFIKPICLQLDKSLRSINSVGETVTVAGYGKTEKLTSSNIKQKVTLDIVDEQLCNQVYRAQGRRIVDSQICSGGKKNIDACRGDSGGPMMKLVNQQSRPYWVLFGIVSYGPSPCGQENKPGVYTRVEKFIDWIESKLRP